MRLGDVPKAWTSFGDTGPSFLVPVRYCAHAVERRLRTGPDGVLPADHPEEWAHESRVWSSPCLTRARSSGESHPGLIGSWLESSPVADPRALSMDLAADRVDDRPVDIDEPENWERAERLAELARD